LPPEQEAAGSTPAGRTNLFNSLADSSSGLKHFCVMNCAITALKLLNLASEIRLVP
jgi:hypothetical protein